MVIRVTVVGMDVITVIALYAAITAVVFYVLYWVIRKAVSAGIRDAALSDRDARRATSD